MIIKYRILPAQSPLTILSSRIHWRMEWRLNYITATFRVVLKTFVDDNMHGYGEPSATSRNCSRAISISSYRSCRYSLVDCAIPKSQFAASTTIIDTYRALAAVATKFLSFRGSDPLSFVSTLGSCLVSSFDATVFLLEHTSWLCRGPCRHTRTRASR